MAHSTETNLVEIAYERIWASLSLFRTGSCILRATGWAVISVVTVSSPPSQKFKLYHCHPITLAFEFRPPVAKNTFRMLDVVALQPPPTLRESLVGGQPESSCALMTYFACSCVRETWHALLISKPRAVWTVFITYQLCRAGLQPESAVTGVSGFSPPRKELLLLIFLIKYLVECAVI